MTSVAAFRQARVIALAAPALLLVGAYVAQYGFGLYPCEMCWWQRYGHFAALGLAVIAWLRPSLPVLTALAGLAIAVAGGIGGFHAGVEYGWWEGLTACASNVPKTGDALEAIFDTPPIRCDVAPWSLIGISLAGWNFLFSGAAALAIFALLARSARPAA